MQLLRLARTIAIPTAASLVLTACSTFMGGNPIMPRNPSEKLSGTSYVPIDGVPVSDNQWECTPPAGTPTATMGESLPDITTRVAVASLDESGSLNFVPFAVSQEGHTYSVLFDQIFVDAVPMKMIMWRKKSVARSGAVSGSAGLLSALKAYGAAARNADEGPVHGAADTDESEKFFNQNAKDYDFQRVIVPVYVGAGIRLNATVLALKGNVNLTSPVGLAVAADAGAVQGTLAVQMIGLGSKETASVMPLTSELNQTTIQNALMALGSAKTLAYTSDKIRPRFVGFFNPVSAGPEWVNDVISALHEVPPTWKRSCTYTPPKGH